MRRLEPIAVADIAGLGWCDPVNWVVAVALTLVSLPFLIARGVGGQPPNPGPKLAALAPLGIAPAVAGVAVAAVSSWWLALGLAGPALILMAWQFPPLRPGRSTGRGKHPPGPALRVLTLNAKGGAADAAAITASVAALEVDILLVQELTAGLGPRLALSGLDDILPQSHLEPRDGSRGTGLWARWPLTPLTPVTGTRRGHSPGPYRPARRPVRHCHRGAPGRAGSGPGTPLAPGTRADPGSPGRHQSARSWRPGISTQPGTTARSAPCCGPASWTAPTPPASGPGPVSPGLPTAASRR